MQRRNNPDQQLGGKRPATHRTTGLLLTALVAASMVGLTGCAGRAPLEFDLMPAPAIYETGEIDPFADSSEVADGILPPILFATDRAPVTDETGTVRTYSDRRGYALRVGGGQIEVGLDPSVTWEEARRISLLKNRTLKYPLRVTGVEDFGPLAETMLPITPENERLPGPGSRFAEAVNEKLSRSRNRDIFIYVHGYKVTFDNPLLVASELWHFLGYDGVFVAYSWPATPKRLAYVSDIEDASLSARNLRKLIAFLAENTDAERIHVLGYSAGTRVVARMLADFGMYTYLVDVPKIRSGLKLGHVLMVGSDVDRDLFGGYLMDGALRVPDAVVLYQSQSDQALSLSRWLFGRERAGEFYDRIDPTRERFLAEYPSLQLIDVSGAPGAKTGNGHSYFRDSPWVSSDVLMTLMYGAAPSVRGLTQRNSSLVWEFPADYPQRLRSSLDEMIQTRR